MLKRLILIVGLPDSGKSTVAKFIKKEINADIVCSGDIIREEIKKRGLKYTPENDVLIADWFNKNGREKLLVKRVWDKIKKSKKKMIVIEGFTSDENIKNLEEISKIKPIVIAIISSFKVRVQRGIKRERFSEKESKKHIKFREKLEKNRGIEKLIGKADYKIDNSALSIRETNVIVSKLLKEILVK
jgi:dephospho-CoA kinase